MTELQRKISAREALENIRRNPMSIWCGNEADSAGANESYAGNRVKARFPEMLVAPRFDLAIGSSVYAMGSCFAREIEAALDRKGFDVKSFRQEDFPAEIFSSPHVWGASNFLNRYNTASMLLEVERLAGIRDLPAEAMLYGPAEKLVDLHFAASCEVGGLDLIAKRRDVTKHVGASIMTADVVVMTLGLTEAWFDRKHGYYINSSPELMTLRRDGDRFEMHNLDFATNLSNLEKIYTILSASGNRKLVLTVSPVPLQATFNNVDILIANFDSKMTLRAVAAEFCHRHPEVLYFPSFEMVFNSDPSHAWKGDRRHVTTAMVDHIISTFAQTHGLDAKATASPRLLTDIRDNDLTITDCVENGLEIVGNEIALHPFDAQTGREASITFSNLPLDDYDAFTSGVSVINAQAEAVEFVARLSQEADGYHVIESALRVEPGASETLTLNLPSDRQKPFNLTLITRMAGPTGSSAHAWSRFLAPKFLPKNVQ